jgi:hypothetical protein
MIDRLISSRDAWQTLFFWLHSYLALMFDSYGIFSSLKSSQFTGSVGGAGQKENNDLFIEKEVLSLSFISSPSNPNSNSNSNNSLHICGYFLESYLDTPARLLSNILF